jgi:VWFA-related protein
MRHLAGIFVGLLAVVGFSLDAQTQTPPQPPTFQSGIDLVQVDVSVLDKGRRPVRGLTQADFTILEDGKPRPILAFLPVELADVSAPPAHASWLRDVPRDVTTNALRPEGRLVVIMLDWSIRFQDQVLARRIATAAVDALGPDDLAAIVFSSGFAHAGTPQNFTADRARLLASINRPWAGALINPEVGPNHDPRNSNGVMIEDPEGYMSGDCMCRACVPETIARIADAVRDVRGRRKTLLFIGTYFRPNEGLQGPMSRQDGAGGFLSGPQIAAVRPGVCVLPLNEAREKMERATALANLTIHTIDPTGLETETNSPLGGKAVAQMERRDGINWPADLTGGRAVMNTGTPEAQVPGILAETGAYYLMAFAPADRKANGRSHKIDVKVARRDVNVRTRSGYIAGKPAAPGGVPSFGSPETIAALQGVLPRTDVPLSVAVAPFATPGKVPSAVAVILNVRQPAPSGANGSAPVKVMAAAFDKDGRSAMAEEQTVTIGWHPDASGSSRYEVVSRLPLKPGRYEVRVALDAGPAQRGSVYTFVDVPDFARQPLSLSGIVLGAILAVPSAPKDAFAGLLPLVPTAQRSFAPTDRATAFVQIYEEAAGTPRPASLRAWITDADDRPVFDETVPLTSDRFGAKYGADYRLDLPLARLDRGEYLLTIEVSERTNVARRGVRFTVR